MTLTAEQEALKKEFIEVRGTWGEHWEGMLRLDPEFLRSYLEFSAVPWRKNHLDDKTKAFMYIAVDAAATHMYLPGVRQHIKAALKFGATPQEIMEAIWVAAEMRAGGAYAHSTLALHALDGEQPARDVAAAFASPEA
ncbi:MAG: carboxymuconolactone decarboxylase family protein [Pseudonocardia sp.]